MRFFADGPVIPDDLLDARDEGRAVFLCGAGVSVPAGMPSFVDLTRHVIKELRVQDASPVRRAFAPWEEKDPLPDETLPSLDRIFSLLQNEYHRNQINLAVEKKLTSKRVRTLQKHRIIARISTDIERKPQIVTTNFDNLFERHTVIKKKYQKIFEPPTFPDLRHDQSIVGITYLHGRFREAGNRQAHDYILSSYDFGRAYLAGGYTTEFMRLLIEKFTVVLVGYGAGDPPVQYLLRGMNDTSARRVGRLYAFDRGTPEDVAAKWGELGATPIAYQGEGNDHSRLWKSLEAWATRADDPAAWRSGIIDLAREGPRALQPHERGQVAHLVRTNIGAKEFADAEPAPPMEWLCVFDNGYRLASGETNLEANEKFIPRDEYALDDDLIARRPDGDLIASLRGDEYPQSEFRLALGAVEGHQRLPSRLSHLCKWIAANPDPVVAWWTAKQYSLHPHLVREISNKVQRLGDRERTVWKLILECHEHRDERARDMDLIKRIETEGWTSSTLRELERCTEPLIKINTMIDQRQVKPPTSCWSKIVLRNILEFDIQLLKIEVKIPDDAVFAVFHLVSLNLIKGIERLEEIGCLENVDWSIYFFNFTLHTDTQSSGDPHRSDNENFTLWVADLMKRAAEIDPSRVAAVVSLWPPGERLVLNKLRFFAWNLPSVFRPSEVASKLMDLDQEAFWNISNQRDFLFLIRGRWKEFTLVEKRRLTKRLLAGPERDSKKPLGEYREWRARSSVIRLRWMEKERCVLPDGSVKRINELQEGLSEWNEAWVEDAARSREGRGGMVERVEDPSVLDGVPIPQIVETAHQHARLVPGEFETRLPFSGLVRSRPARALAALRSVARKGEYPSEFWRALFFEWPDEAPFRATRLLCERSRHLPSNMVNENIYAISHWMENKLHTIALKDEKLAFAVFDDLLDKFIEGGSEPYGKSRQPINDAMNSPMGKAVEALRQMLNNRKLPTEHDMPKEFAKRFERLLNAPVEGANHAVCMLASRLGWLHGVAPDWTKAHITPWFDFDHPGSEFAWNGLLHGLNIPPNIFRTSLKTSLLKLFPSPPASPRRMYWWDWDAFAVQRAHEFLVGAAIRFRDAHQCISVDEAQEAISNFTENGRAVAVNYLTRLGQRNDNRWEELVIPFMREAWPKQRRFQTEGTSISLLRMLDGSGDAFPKVFNAVRHLLCPIHREHSAFYRFYRAPHSEDTEDTIAFRFPVETLDLMDHITDNPRWIPHGFGNILSLISKARPDLTRDKRYVRLRNLLAAQ